MMNVSQKLIGNSPDLGRKYLHRVMLFSCLISCFFALVSPVAAAPMSKKKSSGSSTNEKKAPPKTSSSSKVPDAEVYPENSSKPVSGPAAAEKASSTGETHLAFLYTHSLPSPINLPSGAWTLGTRAAYGLTDFIEISTEVSRDVTRHYNVMAKVPLLEYPAFIASAFIQFGHYNLKHYDSRNPDYAISAWQPGLVTGFALENDMAIFMGGNLHITKDVFPNDAKTSGFANGARANFDWSWMYNPPGGRLSENTISVGVDYDFTQEVFGVGATHHWSTFEIGVHFFPGADHYKVLPVLNISSGF
jgi:hypothetical protein